MASTTRRPVPLAQEPEAETDSSAPLLRSSARQYSSPCDWLSGPYIVDPAGPDPGLTGVRLARRRRPHKRRNAVNIFAEGLRDTAVEAADELVAKEVDTGREGKVAGLRKRSLAYTAAGEAAKKSKSNLWEGLSGISGMKLAAEKAGDNEMVRKGDELFRAFFKPCMDAIVAASEIERREEANNKATEDMMLEAWAESVGVKLRG